MDKKIENIIDKIAERVNNLGDEAANRLIDKLVCNVSKEEYDKFVRECVDRMTNEQAKTFIEKLLSDSPVEYVVTGGDGEGQPVYFRGTCSHIPDHKGENMPVFSSETDDAWTFETEEDAKDCIEWIHKKCPDLELNVEKIEVTGDEDDECMDFSAVIPMLKEGKKLSRLGWNGKNQYIQLSKNVSYQEFDGIHKLGGPAIVFHGSSGVQVGWLASQGDLLAEDWVVVE